MPPSVFIRKNMLLSAFRFSQKHSCFYTASAELADVQFDITLTNENAEILSRGSASVAIPGRVETLTFPISMPIMMKTEFACWLPDPLRTLILQTKSAYPRLRQKRKREDDKHFKLWKMFVHQRAARRMCEFFKNSAKWWSYAFFEIEIDAASLETELSRQFGKLPCHSKFRMRTVIWFETRNKASGSFSVPYNIRTTAAPHNCGTA